MFDRQNHGFRAVRVALIATTATIAATASTAAIRCCRSYPSCEAPELSDEELSLLNQLKTFQPPPNRKLLPLL